MARLARIVLPGLPHHVTQRGNRREQIFFSDNDYDAYLDMLREALEVSNSEVWAWCLMPNHVHLIVVPSDEDGLRKTVANVHRRYARLINSRNKWTGHLWQGRFSSVVMDEEHLYRAIAYVVLNPVRAKLVKSPEDWRWSSIHAHLGKVEDGITSTDAVKARIDDFTAFINQTFKDDLFTPLRKSEIVGRPLGSDAFLSSLESQLGRTLKPNKRGPKTQRNS
jgi:putative transposase